MKLVILFVLLGSAYCFEDGYKKQEAKTIGEANNERFKDLTTHGFESYLDETKYKKDQNLGFNVERRNQGQLYNSGSPKYGRNDDKHVDSNVSGTDKNNDENNEARHIGNTDFCIGEYGDRDRYRKNGNGYWQNQSRKNNSDFYDEEVRERCDYLYGYTGPTANDEPENLHRPCALNDWQCIRSYFSANSKCKPAYGPIPDPLYIDVNTVMFPAINVTVVLSNLQIRGLSSARISEFYVNRKTGNVVFALSLNLLNETTPGAYYRFRRTGKESIILGDFLTATYRAITFTAVIPKVPNLRLDLAEIHPDAQDATPQYIIGPGVVSSTDPDVVSAYTQFNAFLPISVREVFFFQAQLFTSIYIQENICDFGLKLISN